MIDYTETRPRFPSSLPVSPVRFALAPPSPSPSLSLVVLSRVWTCEEARDAMWRGDRDCNSVKPIAPGVKAGHCNADQQPTLYWKSQKTCRSKCPEIVIISTLMITIIKNLALWCAIHGQLHGALRTTYATSENPLLTRPNAKLTSESTWP